MVTDDFDSDTSVESIADMFLELGIFEYTYESLTDLEDVPVPVDPEILAELPVYKIRSNHEAETCVVCLTEYEPGDEVIVFGCSHKFHNSCARQWLATSNRCPLCMSDVSVPAYEFATESACMEPTASVEPRSHTAMCLDSTPAEDNQGLHSECRQGLQPTKRGMGNGEDELLCGRMLEDEAILYQVAALDQELLGSFMRFS